MNLANFQTKYRFLMRVRANYVAVNFAEDDLDIDMSTPIGSHFPLVNDFCSRNVSAAYKSRWCLT